MAKLTQAQILSLWLVACSERSGLAPGNPNLIPLDDDATLFNSAGVDVGAGDSTDTPNQADVRTARDFLLAHPVRVAAARQLFIDMISPLGYNPPGCPPGGQLVGLSRLPSA